MDPSVAPEPLVGRQLEGRYRLLRIVSRGDDADVYEAEDERLQRRVEVHVSAGRSTDVASMGAADQDGVLDAGEDDGHTFVVFPLADPAPTAVVGAGGGDDEPTGELPTATDRTAVLPMPLVPADATAPPDETPDPDPGAVAIVASRLWARRALLVAVAAVMLVVLAGLAARNDGVEVPTDSTVPVTTTTIAPTTTTTTPPTTEAPAEREGKGKGKGKKGDEGGDD